MVYKDTEFDFIKIGSDGEVYTTYYPGYVKKKCILKNGIKVFGVRVNGNKRKVGVANLVGKLFVPNPENFRFALVKDGDEMNTHPNNIYWSKSNRMDYKDFANKKKGMLYKSYVGRVYGDYKVTGSDGKICTLSCTSCGHKKTEQRKKLRKLKNTCENCMDRSLDLSSLSLKYFSNWNILGENGTENLKLREDKEIIIECKCCGQKDIIKYNSFIAKRKEYRCNTLKKKTDKLRRKLASAIRRCCNTKDKSYKNYGGRGITVCKQWTDSPSSFIEWALNNGYELGLEIDRIDNDKGYEPDNCRFVERIINAQNQSTVVLNEEIVIKIKSTDWKDKNNRQIADELGFKEDRIRYASAISQVRRGRTWKNI